jgi:hypothetical protein
MEILICWQKRGFSCPKPSPKPDLGAKAIRF